MTGPFGAADSCQTLHLAAQETSPVRYPLASVRVPSVTGGTGGAWHYTQGTQHNTITSNPPPLINMYPLPLSSRAQHVTVPC